MTSDSDRENSVSCHRGTQVGRLKLGSLRGKKLRMDSNKSSRTILLVSKKTVAQIMEERREKALPFSPVWRSTTRQTSRHVMGKATSEKE